MITRAVGRRLAGPPYIPPVPPTESVHAQHRPRGERRSPLQHASSFSALMLTTEAMICEIPEKKPAAHGHGGPGGMGDMDM